MNLGGAFDDEEDGDFPVWVIGVDFQCSGQDVISGRLWVSQGQGEDGCFGFIEERFGFFVQSFLTCCFILRMWPVRRSRSMRRVSR